MAPWWLLWLKLDDKATACLVSRKELHRPGWLHVRKIGYAGFQQRGSCASCHWAGQALVAVRHPAISASTKHQGRLTRTSLQRSLEDAKQNLESLDTKKHHNKMLRNTRL